MGLVFWFYDGYVVSVFVLGGGVGIGLGRGIGFNIGIW